MTALVTISDAEAPQGVRLPTESDVTIYPESLNNGRGVYAPSALDLADELSGTGVVARPWHELADCEISSEREPVTAAILSVVLGIVSSAGWEAIKRVLRRRSRDDRVSLTIGWRDGTAERWIRVDGPADAVAEAIDRLPR
ncbi:hypothetical protein GKC29_27840 [Micromonospora sp. WMMC415]|uniref:hypothetical protein n=1 Tax=Micromonospora sp. WMMC415 TaxID=2675222 RepID=UPI0012B4B50B|nr:hypothetical protein [Micromonospora sp. WMMC415]QGN50254.1 hypothetical protein GKC29_27840 [Micromonospora sp. WMMC415]